MNAYMYVYFNMNSRKYRQGYFRIENRSDSLYNQTNSGWFLGTDCNLTITPQGVVIGMAIRNDYLQESL